MRSVVVAGAVVAMVLASAARAHADAVTLGQFALTVELPPGWDMISARSGDFFHRDIDDDRSLDVTFEHHATACRTWRDEGGSRKEFPSYWPKRARTHLYTRKTDGKLLASGCLADLPSGGLVVHIELTTPDRKPRRADASSLRDLLAATLVGAHAAAKAKPATDATPSSDNTTLDNTKLDNTKLDNTKLDGATLAAAQPVIDPAAKRGGETVTLPQLELAVKLPRNSYWLVGVRGEPRVERADTVAGPFSLAVFATPFRSCTEWRVDAAASDAARYLDRVAYLPANVGAFATAQSTTACIETKSGPLQLAIEHGDRTFVDAELATVRALVDAIVVAGNKHARTIYAGSPVQDAGTLAATTIGKVTLPAGAQWRVANATIERVDKGRYFAVTAMSRPSCAARTGAVERPFWPAAVKSTLESRAGVTLSRACVKTTRAIELTLAYDGAIAPGDHTLIKSLVEAIVASTAAKTK